MGNVQVTPGTAGLFKRIIAESGGSDNSITVTSMEQKEATGQIMASKAGCPLTINNSTGLPNYTEQNACLRNASIDTLFKAYYSQFGGASPWYQVNNLWPAPDG
jgi:carboxylesterase type B